MRKKRQETPEERWLRLSMATLQKFNSLADDEELLNNFLRHCDPRMFPVYLDTLQRAQQWVTTVSASIQKAKRQRLTLMPKAEATP